ncbi:XVIPCD domain-containing protein [Luteibacter sp. 9133]|uniref:peptidoglycan-binding domain-containing protein n=1 Tax=Luteibacter sp. 9133 TaxID=1500891 RepID=UPI000689C452|nr:XVIPCD domain-containing protein [Luteibacter sp. 9133]
MSKDILDAAEEHFFRSGLKFEYGRPDMRHSNSRGNHLIDSSRTEQDLDGDGYRGVDCSSFVWRGMKNAGYDVGDQPFSTHTLYNGNHTTAYAEKHFDVISKTDAGKTPGDLQPGDVLMLKSKHGSDQHVAIFKGYDAEGHIQFIGSQTSTGPAPVTIMPDKFWGKDMEIVGALRAKPEFRTHEPVHGKAPADTAAPVATHAKAEPSHAVAKAANTPTDHPDTLSKGDESTKVTALQESLSRLGYKDENGHAIKPDGHFGEHTKAAVEKFQRAHGLEADGIVGKATMQALHTATPRLDSAAHPAHPVFQTARDAVHRLDAQHQRTPDVQSDQIAGVLTGKAIAQGMTRVDHAVLNEDASKVYAVQGELNSPFKQVAEASTQQAANTSLEESGKQALQASAQQSQLATNVPTQATPSHAPSQTA